MLDVQAARRRGELLPHQRRVLCASGGFATPDDSVRATERQLTICGAVYGPALAEWALLK